MNGNTMRRIGNEIKRLEIRLWWISHRKIAILCYIFLIPIILLIIFLALLALFDNLSSVTIGKVKIYNNSTTISVVSALFGAIIGGVFSLFGSVYVLNRQKALDKQMELSKELFSPLYEEFVRNRNLMNVKAPLPCLEWSSLKKSDISYSVWENIKGKAIQLSAPPILSMVMETFEENVRKYICLRTRIESSYLRCSYFQELFDNRYMYADSLYDTGRMLIAGGDFIKQALETAGRKRNMTRYGYECVPFKKEEIDSVAYELEQEIVKVDIFMEIRSIYPELMKNQDNIIRYLQLLILINEKRYNHC